MTSPYPSCASRTHRRFPASRKRALEHISPTGSKTVAVTGVTGTLGRGLMPFLEEDPRIGRVIGLTSRGPTTETNGFRKLEHRQVDIRDAPAVRQALKGADVVIHLAFSLYGLRQRRETLDRINFDGTQNVVAAAARGGAERFIYASSGAVYGFAAERPVRVNEDAPIERDQRHFYAHQKAELERILRRELSHQPKLRWIFLRPCAVVGPHATGGASHALPESVRRAATAAAAIGASAGLRPPVPGPPVGLQFVHERDVGDAIHRAITSRRSRSVYNLAGEGVVDPAEIPRLLGLRTLPVPRPLTRAVLGGVARLPYAVPGLGWAQLFTHPLELDTSRAREELGWSPRFTSREALASTRRALGL